MSIFDYIPKCYKHKLRKTVKRPEEHKGLARHFLERNFHAQIIGLQPFYKIQNNKHSKFIIAELTDPESIPAFHMNTGFGNIITNGYWFCTTWDYIPFAPEHRPVSWIELQSRSGFVIHKSEYVHLLPTIKEAKQAMAQCI